MHKRKCCQKSGITSLENLSNDWLNVVFIKEEELKNSCKRFNNQLGLFCSPKFHYFNKHVTIFYLFDIYKEKVSAIFYAEGRSLLHGMAIIDVVVHTIRLNLVGNETSVKIK